MGRRGPPPTPTALLRARGSWRAALRQGEPTAEAGAECPEWLDERAAGVWLRLAPILERMGVLSASDELSLTRYAVLYSRWQELAEEVQAEGSLLQGEKIRDKQGRYRKGPLRRNPRLALMLELQGELGRLEKEFGLTPAARSLVRADQGKVGRKQSGMLRLA